MGIMGPTATPKPPQPYAGNQRPKTGIRDFLAPKPASGMPVSSPYKPPGPGDKRWKGTPDPGAAPGTNGNPGTAPGTPEYGSESGPGILESWFNQRAGGTDPGYEYAMKRGMDAVDSRMAAGGSYNSGARGQQLGDFAANMGAQREGQLDALAGGASGEHQGRLNSMFNYGLGMAGSQAGLAGLYDTAAAQGMSASDQAILAMMLQKAGVDSQANQGLINNVFAGATAFSGGKKK